MHGVMVCGTCTLVHVCCVYALCVCAYAQAHVHVTSKGWASWEGVGNLGYPET